MESPLVDRLTDELHREVDDLDAHRARCIADRLVRRLLADHDLNERSRAAVIEIERVLLESARASQREMLIHKGRIMDILDRYGLR